MNETPASSIVSAFIMVINEQLNHKTEFEQQKVRNYCIVVK